MGPHQRGAAEHFGTFFDAVIGMELLASDRLSAQRNWGE
jgi:hypothetical protein